MSRFKTLKDHVYDYISAQIMDGQLKPLEKINENEISAALSVSRTPVREALIQLSCEGLLECIPRKGFVLSDTTEKQAENLYCIIGVLDALAAETSCPFLSEKEYATMEFHIQSMDYAIDSDQYELYLEHQDAFHEVYQNLCDNEILIDILFRLKSRLFTRGYTKYADSNRRALLTVINSEHKEILRLLREKETRKVSAYISEIHWKPSHARNELMK